MKKKPNYANKYIDKKGWCIIAENTDELMSMEVKIKDKVFRLPFVLISFKEANEITNLLNQINKESKNGSPKNFELAAIELRIVYFNEEKQKI